MPKFPNLQQRVDPGLGNAGIRPQNVRPGPVPDVAGGLNEAASNLERYAAAQNHIARREQTLDDAHAFSSLQETFTEEYRARQTAGGFRRREDIDDFRSAIDARVQETLDGYRGTADGRAAMELKLLNMQDDILARAAGEAVVNQKAELQSTIRTRTGSVFAGINDGSIPLNEAIASIDGIIDEMADALTPAEQIETTANYRAEAVMAGAEHALALGDHRAASELLATPGVAEMLPAAQQTRFAARISAFRRDEENRESERRQRLEDFAGALGTSVDALPVWARAQAVGLQIPKGPDPYKAQTDAGKIVQDREVFVRQYGEESPQVQAFDQAMSEPDSPPSLSDIGGIRKEFSAASKPFVQVRDSYARIQEAANNSTGAGDVALIFNYMKMLDPGSVVREGEFATAENAGGVGNTIINTYNKLLNGERLNDSQRSMFVGMSTSLYQAQLNNHRLLERNYSAIARRSGIDPNQVIVDFVGDAGFETAGEMLPDQQAQDHPAPPGGTQPAPADTAATAQVIEFGMDGKPTGGGG